MVFRQNLNCIQNKRIQNYEMNNTQKNTQIFISKKVNSVPIFPFQVSVKLVAEKGSKIDESEIENSEVPRITKREQVESNDISFIKDDRRGIVNIEYYTRNVIYCNLKY